MPNMSYCRFRNTLPDLQDCFENMDQGPEDPEEARAMLAVIKLAALIVDSYGDLLDDEGE